MPRPSDPAANRFRGRLAIACLLMVAFTTANTAEAGPIADRISHWSSQRQTQTRVDKPFSGSMSGVNLNPPSMVQKLRTRLTSKSKVDNTTHQMKTEQVHFDHGMMSR